MQGSQRLDSPIPRELLTSPRLVLRKGGTLGLLLLGRILTAPVLLVAAALLLFVLVEPILVFLVPAQPARVTATWRDLKARGGTVYYVEYQLVRSGYIGRDEVLLGEYQAYHVGQIVEAHAMQLGKIGYSALDRSLRAYARYRLIIWFGAAFALAISWVFFYALWFSPWRSHWLVKYGKATFGAIVAKSVICSRRQCSYMLTYQFKAQGNLWASRIRISPQRFDSAGLKDLVIILFDPKRPGRNIVYDYSSFMAA
jgi:hypothetical protein